MNTEPHNKTKKLGLLLCIGVVFISSFLFLFRLGHEAIVDYDEGIYAQVIAQTLQANDLLTLKIDKPWFEKPPLYIWSAIVTEKILPLQPEFDDRLPSALAGIITVILLILIAYELTGNLFIAALSGFILALTPAFLEAGRQIRFDVPVTMAIVFSLYSFIKGKKNSWWYIGIGIGIGLGVMFKSIIGFFSLPIILIWSIIHKDFSWLRKAGFWLGMILMALIVAPWHIYESLHFGMQFWNEYLVHHIVNRFESNVLGGTMSNLDYIKYLLSYATPWIIIFIIGIPQIIKNRKNGISASTSFTFLVSTFFIIALFLIAQTKLVYYLVPIFPLLAFVTAYIIYIWFEKYKENRKFFYVLFCIVALIALGNSIYTGYHYQEKFRVNQIIGSEEKHVGQYLLAHPNPQKVYTYYYIYWDTIRYYSKERPLYTLQFDQLLDEPFFLVMSTYNREKVSFTPELEKHFTTIYKGQSIVLLEFKP